MENICVSRNVDKEQEWGKGWQKGHGGDDDED